MADAFSETALDTLGRAKAVGEPKHFFDQRPYVATLFSAATNHTLAVELYLKSCLMIANNGRIKGHDAGKLYKQFGSEHRDHLENLYVDTRKELAETTRISERDVYGLAYGSPDASYEPSPHPQTLGDLMTYVNDSFIKYRYMFEKTHDHSIVYYAFDIEAACRALRAYHYHLLAGATGVSFDPEPRAG